MNENLKKCTKIVQKLSKDNIKIVRKSFQNYMLLKYKITKKNTKVRKKYKSTKKVQKYEKSTKVRKKSKSTKKVQKLHQN